MSASHPTRQERLEDLRYEALAAVMELYALTGLMNGDIAEGNPANLREVAEEFPAAEGRRVQDALRALASALEEEE